jgi:hypothetical protein
MDTSVITGFAALAGAAIGGFTSFVAAWFNQRQQQRGERLAHYQLRRQDLACRLIVVIAGNRPLR